VGVLCDWLDAARRFRVEDGSEEAISVVEPTGLVTYWFWQRGVGGEPDLLLRIGARFFIIEAKYFSGKSGGADEDPSDSGLPKDQLAKYWLACQPGVKREPYPPDLEEAIACCEKHLLYLVSSGHRFHRSLEEVRDSERVLLTKTGEAVPVFLLTWQDLHRVLVLRTRRTGAAARWMNELAHLLVGRKLASFIGFSRALGTWRRGATQALSAWAGDWSISESHTVHGVLDKLNMQAVHQVASARWCLAATSSQSGAFRGALDNVDLRAVGRVASAAWRGRTRPSIYSAFNGVNLNRSMTWRRRGEKGGRRERHDVNDHLGASPAAMRRTKRIRLVILIESPRSPDAQPRNFTPRSYSIAAGALSVAAIAGTLLSHTNWRAADDIPAPATPTMKREADPAASRMRKPASAR
jgi:hypothetical protein